MLSSLISPHPVLAQVKKDFFHPDGIPIQVDENIEGQIVRDGNYVIGLFAGPESNITHLFHEMGHFADREIEKLLEYPSYGWGYNMGKWIDLPINYSPGFFEQSTDQQVKREAKCWAYQISLSRYYSLEVDVCDEVSSATYLPAWCFYRQDLRGGGYKESDKRRISALAEEVETLSKTTHSIDAFKEEWNKRICILRERHDGRNSDNQCFS